MDNSEIENRFTHHPPQTQERIDQHERVRSLFKECALEAVELVPDGRSKSLMLTKLEEALYHANAAVARQDV